MARVSLLTGLTLCGAACDRAPSVSTASITLSEVGALASSGDTIDLLSYGSVDRSQTAAWYLVRVSSARGQLGIYDSTGRPVRIFLPIGRGPAEISSAMSMTGVGFGPGDSILVGEQGGARNSRISVFSPPPEARLVRSFEGPLVFQTTPYGFLSSAFMASPRAYPEFAVGKTTRMLGVPPSLSNWSGGEYARFGTVQGDPVENEFFGATLLADSTHLWFAPARRYRIDLIDRSGSSLRHISRDVDWFPEDTGKADFPWVKRPPTRIQSMSVDGGVMWVLISRASRDWEKRRPKNPPAVKPGMPVQMMFPYARTDLFESVLEAFDERSGKFMGTLELTGDVRHFNNAGQLVEVHEDSSGIVSLRLLKPSLQRR